MSIIPKQFLKCVNQIKKALISILVFEKIFFGQHKGPVLGPVIGASVIEVFALSESS